MLKIKAFIKAGNKETYLFDLHFLVADAAGIKVIQKGSKSSFTGDDAKWALCTLAMLDLDYSVLTSVQESIVDSFMADLDSVDEFSVGVYEG